MLQLIGLSYFWQGKFQKYGVLSNIQIPLTTAGKSETGARFSDYPIESDRHIRIG